MNPSYFKKHVTAREQGDEKALHGGILADDGLADFVTEFLGPSGT